MFAIIRGYLFGLLSGLIIGAGSVAFFLLAPQKSKADAVTVKTISGAPAKVEEIHSTKSSVDITTMYDGTGSSEISVPLSQIPAADSWIHKTTTLQIMAGSSRTFYGSVWKRWEMFSLGGGFRAPLTDPIKRRGDFELLFGAAVTL